MSTKYAMPIEPLSDQYQIDRGGYSTFLLIHCAHCARAQFLYQKDGDGPLLRCYLNRIRLPFHNAIEQLRCHGCDRLLGERGRYKDGRLAYFLLPDAIRCNDLGPDIWTSDRRLAELEGV